MLKQIILLIFQMIKKSSAWYEEENDAHNVFQKRSIIIC